MHIPLFSSVEQVSFLSVYPLARDLPCRAAGPSAAAGPAFGRPLAAAAATSSIAVCLHGSLHLPKAFAGIL